MRELDIGSCRIRALDNVSIFMLELSHTADNFSLYLHRLKLQPPNLGSCLVHQKLQVSFLFLVHSKLFFCFPDLGTVLLLKLFPVRLGTVVVENIEAFQSIKQSISQLYLKEGKHCLVPRRLKCGKRKTRLRESSTSIAQWTIGTFSADAKDAWKGEREK